MFQQERKYPRSLKVLGKSKIKNKQTILTKLDYARQSENLAIHVCRIICLFVHFQSNFRQSKTFRDVCKMCV